MKFVSWIVFLALFVLRRTFKRASAREAIDTTLWSQNSKEPSFVVEDVGRDEKVFSVVNQGNTFSIRKRLAELDNHVRRFHGRKLAAWRPRTSCPQCLMW